MSALLSPAKPVRTRFKVPGEGAYELHTDLPPPPPRPYAAPTSVPTPQPPPAKPAVPPFSGGPLGLPRITKLSYAPNATLRPDPPPPPPPPNPPSPASTPSTSSLFSLRKLTGLSLGKLSSSATEEDPAPVSAPAAATPTTQISLSTSATSSTTPKDEDGPRAPPPIASSDLSRRIDPLNPPQAGVIAFNSIDSLTLLDLTSRATSELPLLPVSKASPTCHALFSRDGLRLIVGCANGEVLYFADVVAAAAAADSKRSRGTTGATGAAVGVGGSVAASVASVVSSGSSSTPAPAVYNRDGTLNASRVVCLRWFSGPNTSLRFAAVHADGAVVLHDARQKPASMSGLRASAASAAMNGSSNGVNVGGAGGNEEHGKGDARGSPGGSEENCMGGERGGDKERERSGLSTGSGGDKSSVSSSASGAPTGSHRRTGSAILSSGGISGGLGGNGGSLGMHEVTIVRHAKGKRGNSAVVWQIGRGALTACDFSPEWTNESVPLAVTGRDGYLRVVDVQREVPVIAFRSYFGALLCVAWSPDGLYVATGGEDDLVSIWSPREERLVARLEGHSSWVSAVAWDRSLCVAGRYRVGSAGQDAKLLLWDFALDVLHHRGSHRVEAGVVKLRSYRRGSSETIGSGANGGGTGGWKGGKLGRLRGSGGGEGGGGGGDSGDGIGGRMTPVVVRAAGRAEVAVVEPVAAHVAHGEPLTDVWFDEMGVFTADAAGGVKMWQRPPQHAVPELSLGEGRGSGGGGDVRVANDLD